MKGIFAILWLFIAFSLISWTASGQLCTDIVVLMHFDNNASLGESSTHVRDYSASGNNGTVQGATWTESGMFGGAFDYDGDNDHIEIPYYPDDGPKTLSYWVNFDSTYSRQASGAHDNNDHRFYVGIYRGDIFFGAGNRYDDSASSGAGSDSWHLLTLTLNGSVARAYVDDVMRDTFTYSQSGTSALPFHAGNLNDRDYRVNGMIDELVIWNRTITSDEVIELFNEGPLYHCDFFESPADTEAPTAFLYPLTEYANTTAIAVSWSGSDDSSGIDHYDMCIETSSGECTSPYPGWSGLTATSREFTGISGNTYYFRVRATDVAGNTAEWSDPVITTIDTQPPIINDPGPEYPENIYLGSDEPMTVNATFSDDAGIMEVSFMINETEITPNETTGGPGDTQWLVTWVIPYNTYITQTGFSITMTDINGNSDTESFGFSALGCNPGDERECDPRDPVTGDVYTQGVCRHTATRICQADGTWGNCTGGILPSSENCNNLDDDCDGETDDGLDNEPCGPSTEIGICEYGSRDCVNGSWTPCLNAVFPRPTENCNNNLDEDCDGDPHNGCDCTTNGETSSCGESDTGACRLGIATCMSGKWGNCIGAVLPVTEICGDNIDNDCDAFTDCDDSDCSDSFECEPDPGPDPGPEQDEPFPWWILSVIGGVILVVLAILVLYFRSQGEELTWDTVKKKYNSVKIS